MRAISLMLVLITWVMLAPYPLGTFGSAAACSTEAAAWAGRAQEGARWINERYREALHQADPAVTAFWTRAMSRAAEQVAQARAARCAEVKL